MSQKSNPDLPLALLSLDIHRLCQAFPEMFQENKQKVMLSSDNNF